MNTVKLKGVLKISHWVVSSLCLSGETAFVGKCGYGPKHSLYLISHSQIMLASDTRRAWSGNPTILVDRFCDIEIKEAI